MVVQHIKKTVMHVFRSWYEYLRMIFLNDRPTQKTYYKEIALAVGALIIVSAGVFGYWRYRIHVNQKAQYAFAQAMVEFNKASKAGEAAEWQSVADLFSTGYTQHSSSTFAPFFKSFYAESCLRQGNKEEAVHALDEALARSSSSSLFTPLLKIKHALLLIDVPQLGRAQEGIEALIALAHNSNSSVADQALYHLGFYYWSQDKQEDAKKEWQSLVSRYGQDAKERSIWAARAQQILEYLS